MAFALTCLYLALLLLRPTDLRPEWAQYQIMDTVGIAAVLATALSLIRGRLPALGGPLLPLGIGFILWSSLSVVMATGWLGGAWTRAFALSIGFFVLMLIAVNTTTARHMTIVAGLLVATLVVTLVQSLSAYYSGVDQSPFFITVSSRGTFDAIVGEPETGLPLFEEGDTEGVPGRGSVKRIQGLGFLNDPNDFAQALVATIPLLFVAWRPRRFLRNAVLVLPPLAAFTWGILLTRSRGGLLGLLGLLPIAVLLNLPRRLRRPAIAASALLAIPAFVGLFGYAQADSSAASRLEAWSSGLLMLKSSPLWGVGLGFFTDHHERVAHNSMVQCFAETGLVGYFLWLGFVVVTLDRLSWLVDHGADPALARWAGALRLSILGFLTCALFLSRTTSPMLFYLAGLPAALGSVTRAWGQRLPTNRFWPLKTLALESVSILLVWVTARAFH